MKRRWSFAVLLLVVCIVLSGLSTAAEKQPAAKVEKPSQAAPAADSPAAAAMKASQPGEFHQALRPLVGAWRTTVKIPAAPDTTEISEGECTNTLVMGGRFLREECTGSLGGSRFEGMGFLGYDSTGRKYVGVWADTMGTGLMLSEGEVDASRKVFTMRATMQDPATGRELPVKSILKIVDGNRMIESTYAVRDGKETLQMEIVYTRK